MNWYRVDNVVVAILHFNVCEKYVLVRNNNYEISQSFKLTGGICRYTIVKLCWELKPEKRPTFSTLTDHIEDYWERDHAYIIRSLSTTVS